MALALVPRNQVAVGVVDRLSPDGADIPAHVPAIRTVTCVNALHHLLKQNLSRFPLIRGQVPRRLPVRPRDHHQRTARRLTGPDRHTGANLGDHLQLSDVAEGTGLSGHASMMTQRECVIGRAGIRPGLPLSARSCRDPCAWVQAARPDGKCHLGALDVLTTGVSYGVVSTASAAGGPRRAPLPGRALHHDLEKFAAGLLIGCQGEPPKVAAGPSDRVGTVVRSSLGPGHLACEPPRVDLRIRAEAG
jgi:hypothetical protein